MSTRSREVRLGVVMFGGVSLAVYINGVSQELYRAVRGRGMYRLLKALTDSEIVVDILSGASAGGINSVLLATALCNETDFASTAKLWREGADIAPLLSMDDESGEVPHRHPKDSVLDGEYHHRQLQAALTTLVGAGTTPAAPGAPGENRYSSAISELDLFVTATDMDGQKSRWRDALNHEIELEDHRVLFRLKHRAGRNTPFAGNAAADGSPTGGASVLGVNIEALTTISHITSCFPGAFVPRKVTIPVSVGGGHDHFNSPLEAVDARLSYWGKLKPFQGAHAQSPRQAIFMDGGVLKNRPITSTIGAIFSRLADRQVSRYMLYVDPDPSPVSSCAPLHLDANDPARRLFPVGLAAASGLPRFESINGDLAQVELHNQQVRRYEGVVKEAAAAALAGSPAVSGDETPTARAYRRARIAGLAAAVMEAVLASQVSPAYPLPGQRPAVPELPTLIDRLCLFSGLSELLQQLDVLFGFRRLVHITYSVDEARPGGLQERQAPGRRVWVALPKNDGTTVRFAIDHELLVAINRQIELYEVVRARLESELKVFEPQAQRDFGDERFWFERAKRAQDILRRLPRPQCFSGTGTGVGAGIVMDTELTALRDRRGASAERSLDDGTSFFRAAEAYERRLLEGTQLRELHERFGQIDEVAYPLELVSEIRSRDQIRTVRISPLDSKRGLAGKFKKKLCGAQLADFGAFFKASWRSNDLMWGRLDGASQLLDLLLDANRLENLDPHVLRANLEDALGKSLNLQAVFPHLPDHDRKLLQDWLENVSSPVACEAAAARTALDDGPTFRGLWARAVQLEILVQELPEVLRHAVQETTGSEKANWSGPLNALTSMAPLELGKFVEGYFDPEHYKISEELLPGAMDPARLRALLTAGRSHLKGALLASLPTNTFGRMVHGAANAMLSAALWLVATAWQRGKLRTSSRERAPEV